MINTSRIKKGLGIEKKGLFNRVGLCAGVAHVGQWIVGDEKLTAFFGLALFVIVHAILQFPIVNMSKFEICPNDWGIIVGDKPIMLANFHLLGKLLVVKFSM
jgi:hypothetical protein